MPHANTVTPSPLTSVAASTAVCSSDLPGAASTVWSPSEMNSTNLATPWRPSSAKSCRAASNASEIEVLPSAVIWSIPALIWAASYDHRTRVVASDAKDTTEKRAASAPREYWFTSSLAKAFSPLGPSIEPWGGGLCIEPLSSSTRMKSIGVAQGGLGEGGGGDRGGGDGDCGGGDADGGFGGGEGEGDGGVDDGDGGGGDGDDGGLCGGGFCEGGGGDGDERLGGGGLGEAGGGDGGDGGGDALQMAASSSKP